MIRFSEVDFEDKLYCISGKVDEYALAAFEPLKDALSLLDNSETLTVFYTVYLLDDGDTQASRDARDEEVSQLEHDFKSLLANGQLKPQEEGYFKIYGLLPEPFEDYYTLTGTERRDYLSVKTAELRERNRLRHNLEEEGYDEDEIELWFRYNYYAQIENL